MDENGLRILRISCRYLLSMMIFFLFLATSGNMISGIESPLITSSKTVSGLKSPVRIDIGKNDLIYVSDYINKRIVILKSKKLTLKLKKSIRINGYPLGVAVYKDKFIFVGNDTKNLVQVYRENGKLAYKLSVKTRRPNDIAISTKKKVYVVASDENLIKVYSFRGEFMFSFGGQGSGSGEFNFPAGIAIDNENREVIISDFLNKRIQVFDMDGNWLRSFGGGMFMSTVDRPQGVFVDKNGCYHIVDSHQACVHVFNYQGTRIRSYGEYGGNKGQLRTPLDIVLDRNGNAFITSNLNKNVEIFKGVVK